MTIKTNIGYEHLSLIQIFLQANQMDKEILVTRGEYEYHGEKHFVIDLTVLNEDIGTQLTYMAIRHSGIQNMLHHYLIRCGVDRADLEPASLIIQQRKEREDESNRRMMEQIYGKNNPILKDLLK